VVWIARERDRGHQNGEREVVDIRIPTMKEGGSLLGKGKKTGAGLGGQKPVVFFKRESSVFEKRKGESGPGKVCKGKEGKKGKMSSKTKPVINTAAKRSGRQGSSEIKDHKKKSDGL